MSKSALLLLMMLSPVAHAESGEVFECFLQSNYEIPESAIKPAPTPDPTLWDKTKQAWRAFFPTPSPRPLTQEQRDLIASYSNMNQSFSTAAFKFKIMVEGPAAFKKSSMNSRNSEIQRMEVLDDDKTIVSMKYYAGPKKIVFNIFKNSMEINELTFEDGKKTTETRGRCTRSWW